MSLRSANEGDYYGWTYFHPGQTSLNVTFSRKPAAPSPQNFTTTADCWSVCAASSAIVRNPRPTLRANVSDPDGGNLSTVFEVRASPSDSATLRASSSGIAGSSGSTAQWQVSTALAQGTHYWRARSTDELGVTGPWSGWQTLTVDTTVPSPPTVSSTQWPLRQWGAVVGTAGSFTLSAPSGEASEFFWSIDGGTQTTVVGSISGSNRTASVPHTPGTDMAHLLAVRQRDRAGNIGGIFNHEYWVSPLPNRCWRWTLNSNANDTGHVDTEGICATVPGTVEAPKNGTVSGSVTWGAGFLDNAAVYTGNGQIATSGPVVDTSKSFTVTAFVNPSNLALGDQTIVSQDGSNRSRFRLWFDADGNAGAGAWCMSLASADDASASVASACAAGDVWGPPVQGDWVHLAGVYNSGLNKLTVHVMGGIESCPMGETATVDSVGT